MGRALVGAITQHDRDMLAALQRIYPITSRKLPTLKKKSANIQTG